MVLIHSDVNLTYVACDFISTNYKTVLAIKDVVGGLSFEQTEVKITGLDLFQSCQIFFFQFVLRNHNLHRIRCVTGLFCKVTTFGSKISNLLPQTLGF